MSTIPKKTPELLWPLGIRHSNIEPSTCADELELGSLAAAIFSKKSDEALKYAFDLLTDDEYTLELRRNILNEFIINPQLAEKLNGLVGICGELYNVAKQEQINSEGLSSGAVVAGIKDFIESFERLTGNKSGMVEAESERRIYYAQLFRASVFAIERVKLYTKAVRMLKDALSDYLGKNNPLSELAEWADNLFVCDNIQAIENRLENISEWWTDPRAFSIDIGFSKDMRPISIELADISSQKYIRDGLFDQSENFFGLSPTFKFPQNGSTESYQGLMLSELGIRLKNKLNKLRRECADITFSGLEQLTKVGEELDFYISTSMAAQKLIKRGMPVTIPTKSDEHRLYAQDAYMALPAFYEDIPQVNDVYLPLGGSFGVITGANGSGKTTYLITIGQLQWLGQLGCFLPASKASLYSTDGIYCLFAAGEGEKGEDSRMGIETARLSEISYKSTSNSILLMNEPMTSTSAAEGIEIVSGLIKQYIFQRICGMVVTHYSEIYTLTRQRLEEDGNAELLKSLVMKSEPVDGGVRHSFKVYEGEPARSSYASAVAARYGVTLENMLKMITEKGVQINENDSIWSKLERSEQE